MARLIDHGKWITQLARIHTYQYIENRKLVVFSVACFVSDSGDFNAWRTRDFVCSGFSCRNYQDVGAILMTSRCFSGATRPRPPNLHSCSQSSRVTLFVLDLLSINHALGANQSARCHSISLREDDNSSLLCDATCGRQSSHPCDRSFAGDGMREKERKKK